MRYIGLDLGSRTLGVALSDPSGIIASSYCVLRHNEDYEGLVVKVKEIVLEKKVDEIVLGLPKNMNNTLGEKAELSYKFKSMLESSIGIPVHLVDERLTTKLVTNLLISNDTSRKKRKEVVDSMAATVILQSFLDINGRRNKDEK